MNKNFLETLIGALVLLVAAYFLYYAYSTTQLVKVEAGQYTVFAKFDSADGINLGSDVKIAGVKIGQVVSHKLDKKSFQAVVGMSINSDIQLGADTSAAIISASLLGEKYINLAPGSDEEILKNDSYIQFTQSTMNIEGLVSKFVFGSQK